jgi:hypothetical protein
MTSGLVPNEDYDSGILATLTSSPFAPKRNMEARDRPSNPGALPTYTTVSVASVDYCEQKCTRTATCNVFTYNKKNGTCSMYRIADLVPNEDYDSGIRK